ncbi:MAG: phospholipase D-like domain-containing protein [Ferruginibacter sp.]
MTGTEVYASNGQAVLTQHEQIVHGGSEYFKLLLQLIDRSEHCIHLQTYIFEEDETGKMLASSLRSAAARGVEVYLLVDGYASQSLSKNFITELREAGIHFRFFEPLLKSRNFYFGRRMHHKVFVSDSACALVGGINISNRYNDMPGTPAWLDFAFYTEGNPAKELCVLCWKTWNGFSSNTGIAPCEKNCFNFTGTARENSFVRMRRNDWVRTKNEISRTYQHMFRQAHTGITIMCSYFLPGNSIRRLLGKASARGVKIKVVTAGLSDVMLAKHAERWLYDWLLRNKIEVYEYQPSVLHAKLAICDGHWFTIGSYNLNKISAYASIELNLDVHQPAMARAAHEMVDKIIREDCRLITMEGHLRSKNPFNQFIRWCSYQLISIIFHLLTFYYKQRN